MVAQRELEYEARYLGNESWARHLEIIRAAVSHLTSKAVADELDVNGSALSDAMNERDNKRWAARWTKVLIVMLGRRGDEVARRLQRALLDEDANLTPLCVKERDVMGPKELAAAYERALRRFGSEGERLIAAAQRGDV